MVNNNSSLLSSTLVVFDADGTLRNSYREKMDLLYLTKNITRRLIKSRPASFDDNTDRLPVKVWEELYQARQTSYKASVESLLTSDEIEKAKKIANGGWIEPAHTLLPQLRAMNASLAILSNNPSVQTLKNEIGASPYGAFFDEIYSGIPFRQGKPHPSSLGHVIARTITKELFPKESKKLTQSLVSKNKQRHDAAMDRIWHLVKAAPPSFCMKILMVGDAVCDIATAQNMSAFFASNGLQKQFYVQSLAVGYGFNSTETLAAAKPDFSAETPAIMSDIVSTWCLSATQKTSTQSFAVRRNNFFKPIPALDPSV